MANFDNKKNYSKYDSMSTESLEELLRLDAELPVGEGTDIDEILYILEAHCTRQIKISKKSNPPIPNEKSGLITSIVIKRIITITSSEVKFIKLVTAVKTKSTLFVRF